MALTPASFAISLSVISPLLSMVKRIYRTDNIIQASRRKSKFKNLATIFQIISQKFYNTRYFNWHFCLISVYKRQNCPVSTSLFLICQDKNPKVNISKTTTKLLDNNLCIQNKNPIFWENALTNLPTASIMALSGLSLNTPISSSTMACRRLQTAAGPAVKGNRKDKRL